MTAQRRALIIYDCLFPLDHGGGERLYRAIADLLVKDGWHVDYLTRDQWSPGPPPSTDFDLVGTAPITIHDERGNRIITSAVRFGWSVLRYTARHRRSYDLVLASALPVLTALAARVGLLGSRTPVAFDWLEAWTYRKWREYSGAVVGTLSFVLQRIAIAASRFHTADSPFTARQLRALGARTAPVVLGLVDLAAAPSRPTLEQLSPPVALFVGRHIPDKQLETLPAAIAQARASIPDLICTVVGSGPTTELARAAVREAGLESVVTFAGRVSDEELDAAMAGAAVLVNPSRREGFGLVIVEAAAHGTPSVVVYGEDNAAVDLISPGVNGVVAADTSPVALGQAIVELVRGGSAKRREVHEWYEREKRDSSLAVSMAALVERVGLSRD